MDDREVELIDYLRVLWWGKWIILGTLALALICAYVAHRLRPADYAASMSFRMYESYSAIAPLTLIPQETPQGEDWSALAITSPLQYRELLTKRALLLDGASGLGSAIAGSRGTVAYDSITVSVRGSEASVVAEALDKVLPTLVQRIAQRLNVELNAEKARIATRIEQQSLNLEVMRRRKGSLLLPESDHLQSAYASEVIALEKSIALDESRLDQLAKSPPEDLFSLLETDREATRKTSHSAKMNLVVGGFLGLVVGFFATFLGHYAFHQARKTKEERERVER